MHAYVRGWWVRWGEGCMCMGVVGEMRGGMHVYGGDV